MGASFLIPFSEIYLGKLIWVLFFWAAPNVVFAIKHWGFAKSESIALCSIHVSCHLTCKDQTAIEMLVQVKHFSLIAKSKRSQQNFFYQIGPNFLHSCQWEIFKKANLGSIFFAARNVVFAIKPGGLPQKWEHHFVVHLCHLPPYSKWSDYGWHIFTSLTLQLTAQIKK